MYLMKIKTIGFIKETKKRKTAEKLDCTKENQVNYGPAENSFEV